MYRFIILSTSHTKEVSQKHIYCGDGGVGDSQLRKYMVRNLFYKMLEIRQFIILGLGLQHLCIWSRTFIIL